MTTVVIGNPVRNLRLIIDRVFQGLHNLFFDKEVDEEVKKENVEVKEPRGYFQKGGKKQMCDAEPYETEHAYGLTYDYEEEKVAPTFRGPQFQVYLERAAELCDDDPECKYFNVWTDGGITKYRDCEKLKDTINSTLTYEKIPPPPALGTTCEDKGYKPYNWYDFKKGVVPLSEGAGEANSEWNEYGDCVRVSCKDAEKKELNALRKCVPTTVEQLSREEQIAILTEKKAVQHAADEQQAKQDMRAELGNKCITESFMEGFPHQWSEGGRTFTITRNNVSNDCYEASLKLMENSGGQGMWWKGDGVGEDWQTGGDAAGVWW